MKRACLDEEAIDVENVLSVQLHDVGKLDAALHEPDAIGVSLGEAVVVEVSTPGVVQIGSGLKITEDGVLSVDTADAVEQDNTKPVTSAAVHVEIGNIWALLAAL